ncbi:MAG: hypothetical protein HGA51_02845 [Demequinaceae bacterium]|nr:hypothetical protein [Demequinaceae bacterium]
MEMDEHQARILGALMKNSKTSSPVFQALADADHGTLASHQRAALDDARGPGTSRERLQELGASPNSGIRRAVAGRQDCPLGLMILFCSDGSHEVRTALAGNPAAGSVLGQMVDDRDHDVLKALVANPALSHAALVGLASHKRRDIRKTAAARLLVLGQAQRASEDSGTPELRDRPWFGSGATPPQR